MARQRHTVLFYLEYDSNKALKPESIRKALGLSLDTEGMVVSEVKVGKGERQ